MATLTSPNGRCSAKKEFSRSPRGDPILVVRRALGDRFHSLYSGSYALFPLYQFHPMEHPDPAKVGGPGKLYPYFHSGSRLRSISESDGYVCPLQHPSLHDHCPVSGDSVERSDQRESVFFEPPFTSRRSYPALPRPYCGSGSLIRGLVPSMDFSAYLASKAQAGSAIPSMPCGD